MPLDSERHRSACVSATRRNSIQERGDELRRVRAVDGVSQPGNVVAFTLQGTSDALLRAPTKSIDLRQLRFHVRDDASSRIGRC